MYDLIQENHQPKENKLMKKIILLVCAITALCSCGGSGNQNEKKVREVVEAKLKTEMNDWSSYEFVSAEAIDTIKYIDNINYRKEYFQKSIENNKVRKSGIGFYCSGSDGDTECNSRLFL